MTEDDGEEEREWVEAKWSDSAYAETDHGRWTMEETIKRCRLWEGKEKDR